MWVDLQINGYAGVNFNAPDLTVDAVRHVTEALQATGTGAYLVTLVTMQTSVLETTLRTVVAARKQYPICKKNILGFFLEGPFISSEPGAVGAHNPDWVQKPNIELFQRLQDIAEGQIRMVNVAAEIPGMPAFVHWLTEQKITVTLGHQMSATATQIEPCLLAGAKAFTHLGNGLPNLIDRHNNIIATALVEDRAQVMFIPDGFHLPDTLLKLYYRACGAKRLIAVSDAQYPAGMPPGVYPVGGLDAVLEPSGKLWYPPRQCLVGATQPMGVMMPRLQRVLDCTADELQKIGYENPLALIN